MALKSIFFLVATLVFLFIHSYNYNIEEIKTCVQKELPVNIRIAYDNWIEYRTYLQNKANEVDRNELKINNGKRLPTLISTEDYIYTILHYLPSSLKHHFKQQQLQHYQSSSKERHQQFHQIITNLPPHLQQDAIEAKENLSLFISTIPTETHVHDLIQRHFQEWETYKEHLKELLKDIRYRLQLQLDTHQIILEEKKSIQHQHQLNNHEEKITLDYLFKNNDHYISAKELYLRWSNEKIEIDHIASRQQSVHQEWGSHTEKRFVDNATTLGPLRYLAEAMFDEAKTKTVQSLDRYTLNRKDILLEWNTYSKTVLDDFMQHSSLSNNNNNNNNSSSHQHIITTMEDLHQVYEQMMGAIKRCEDALPLLKYPKETEYYIDRVWKRATKELSYTFLQQIYWKDLWERKKLETKLFFKRSLNKVDELIG